MSEARQAERTRIAREMHDVLAHRISLLAVHAGALEFNPDASPEEIARAAAVIRESARAAQEELREVIGVLRTDPAAPASSETEPLEPPQPTLEDLAPLIEESRAAGMQVRLATALDPVALPPILGRTVYRVVQEGLTNVRKHAPEHVVTIAVVGGHHGGVRVSVTNQPAVGRADECPAPEHIGSGTGLVGLGERVALLGGTLESRPAARRRLPVTGDAALAERGAVMRPIRVLIVDDDPLVRAGLVMMLGGTDQVEVVGEASDGSEVLSAVDHHRPDVVLLDLRMPQGRRAGGDGAAAHPALTRRGSWC